MGELRVGTAGWSVARTGPVGGEGSHLERYAQVFAGVEINSSFYRPHRVSTYARWSAAVPEGFRFAVKVPKTVTHDAGFAEDLGRARELLSGFAGEVSGLGEKLGPLLLQLPPRQSFAVGSARALLELVRELWPEGAVVLEPRHASWFGLEAEELLREFRIARVAADPAVVPAAAGPGGWEGVVYWRLHGSPRMYYSAYTKEFLEETAGRLRRERATGAEVWCVFDNTAAGAAVGDALRVMDAVR